MVYDRLNTESGYFIAVQIVNNQPDTIWINLGDDRHWFTVAFTPDETNRIIALLQRAIIKTKEEETP